MLKKTEQQETKIWIKTKKIERDKNHFEKEKIKDKLRERNS